MSSTHLNLNKRQKSLQNVIVGSSFLSFNSLGSHTLRQTFCYFGRPQAGTICSLVVSCVALIFANSVSVLLFPCTGLVWLFSTNTWRWNIWYVDILFSSQACSILHCLKLWCFTTVVRRRNNEQHSVPGDICRPRLLPKAEMVLLGRSVDGLCLTHHVGDLYSHI